MIQGFENNKYTLHFNEKTGQLIAYRHGEFWQDLSGNKLIYLMMHKIADLEFILESLEE